MKSNKRATSFLRLARQRLGIASTPKRSVLVVSIAVMLCVVYAKLAQEGSENKPLTGEMAVPGWIHSFTNPAMSWILFVFTNAGGVASMAAMSALLITACILRKRYNAAIFALAAMGGAGVLLYASKVIIRRDRPAFWRILIDETSYSFPSGHSLLSMTFVLVVCIILWHTKWRKFSLLAGAVFVAMVGLSRVYLGVHYPSDVIGAWCAAALWVLLCLGLLQVISRARSAAATL